MQTPKSTKMSKIALSVVATFSTKKCKKNNQLQLHLPREQSKGWQAPLNRFGDQTSQQALISPFPIEPQPCVLLDFLPSIQSPVHGPAGGGQTTMRHHWTNKIQKWLVNFWRYFDYYAMYFMGSIIFNHTRMIFNDQAV